MSGYYGPSGSYLYDSEEYVALTKAAHDALAARVRELEEALRTVLDERLRSTPGVNPDGSVSTYSMAETIAAAALTEKPKP